MRECSSADIELISSGKITSFVISPKDSELNTHACSRNPGSLSTYFVGGGVLYDGISSCI